LLFAPARVAEHQTHVLGRPARERGEIAEMLGGVDPGIDLGGGGDALDLGLRARVEDRAELRAYRSAEVGELARAAAPVDLHAAQDVGDEELGRPIDDQTEAALAIVMDEENDALMEERVTHLRHGRE
jgi:hypothetical protein